MLSSALYKLAENKYWPVNNEVHDSSPCSVNSSVMTLYLKILNTIQ